MSGKRTDLSTNGSDAPPPIARTEDKTQQVAAPLPNEHVQHSLVFRNELEVRKAGFEAGVMALQSEQASREQAYHKAREKLDAEYSRDVDDLTARMADLDRGARMAAAALATLEAMEVEQQNKQ